ncbi:MAG: MBL fold metallo-hydrolase [Candidatus Aminicenantes bacterium]|nr:MBL fold metallo-hydrolase [Candidatus Aminicenantes bacterium]
MFKTGFFLAMMTVWMLGQASALGAAESEVFKTSQGELKITLLKHASLMFSWKGMVVHVDPVGDSADYSALPQAALILITHAHSDHLDPTTVGLVRTPQTEVILTDKAMDKIQGTVMKNGETRSVEGLRIEAVPAYNRVHMRSPNVPYHPRGEGNGYVLTFGDLRVYVAGDTENIPEMKALKNIDVAFLPMNLPYTMTPEMAADAVKSFRPKIVYPYHYRGTDPQGLAELLKGETGVEVRIRNFY